MNTRPLNSTVMSMRPWLVTSSSRMSAPWPQSGCKNAGVKPSYWAMGLLRYQSCGMVAKGVEQGRSAGRSFASSAVQLADVARNGQVARTQLEQAVVQAGLHPFVGYLSVNSCLPGIVQTRSTVGSRLEHQRLGRDDVHIKRGQQRFFSHRLPQQRGCEHLPIGQQFDKESRRTGFQTSRA